MSFFRDANRVTLVLTIHYVRERRARALLWLRVHPRRQNLLFSRNILSLRALFFRRYLFFACFSTHIPIGKDIENIKIFVSRYYIMSNERNFNRVEGILQENVRMYVVR